MKQFQDINISYIKLKLDENCLVMCQKNLFYNILSDPIELQFTTYKNSLKSQGF